MLILEPKVKYKNTPTCSQTPVLKNDTFMRVLAHHIPVLAERAQRGLSQQHRTQEMRMKIKVRREQNKRASQETNRKNCQNHCERLPPAHTAVLLERQPKTASVPRAVHGHNEKLQKGASEAEGSSPVASLSDKEAKVQRGPGEGAASRRGARNSGRPAWGH